MASTPTTWKLELTPPAAKKKRKSRWEDQLIWYAGDPVARAAGIRLLGTTLEYLKQKVFRLARHPKNATHAVLGGLAVTAFHRGKVVRHLLEAEGLSFRADQEAAVLTRALLDLAITATYMSSAPGAQRDHLAARFLAFENLQVEKLTASPRKSGSRKAAHVLRVYKDLEKRGYRGWSGLTNSEMIHAIREKALRDIAKDLQHYFSVLSIYVHPTPAGTRLAVGGPSLADELLDYVSPFAASLAVECTAKAFFRAVKSPLDPKSEEALHVSLDEYIATAYPAAAGREDATRPRRRP